MGCHRLGASRKETSVITVKNVNAKKKLSSLPNLEKYSIVGLVSRRTIVKGVPIAPRFRRQIQGSATTAIPEIAGRRRAILSDWPNNQKKADVI